MLQQTVRERGRGRGRGGVYTARQKYCLTVSNHTHYPKVPMFLRLAVSQLGSSCVGLSYARESLLQTEKPSLPSLVHIVSPTQRKSLRAYRQPASKVKRQEVWFNSSERTRLFSSIHTVAPSLYQFCQATNGTQREVVIEYNNGNDAPISSR